MCFGYICSSFSAPTPTLSLISAPASAIYCHLKLFSNISTIPMEVEIKSAKSRHKIKFQKISHKTFVVFFVLSDYFYLPWNLF